MKELYRADQVDIFFQAGADALTLSEGDSDLSIEKMRQEKFRVLYSETLRLYTSLHYSLDKAQDLKDFLDNYLPGEERNNLKRSKAA